MKTSILLTSLLLTSAVHASVPEPGASVVHLPAFVVEATRLPDLLVQVLASQEPAQLEIAPPEPNLDLPMRRLRQRTLVTSRRMARAHSRGALSRPRA